MAAGILATDISDRATPCTDAMPPRDAGLNQSGPASLQAPTSVRGMRDGHIHLEPPTRPCSCPDMRKSPTYNSPPPEGMSPVLERNIQELCERRRREETAATPQEKLADAITAFTGSMVFVYLHLAAFGFWIAANLHWVPGIPAWDESFVVLAMVASVEAIFLSTFVLISQNRMAAEADKRADLDLQISLLTEHELTMVARLLKRVAHKIKVEPEAEQELTESTGHIAPERVLDKIEETKE
jgi:uncharacterized membrane protein